jgi:hypothetical protein
MRPAASDWLSQQQQHHTSLITFVLHTETWDAARVPTIYNPCMF